MHIILTILALIITASYPSNAADMYTVGAGATVTINEHGYCRRVTNPSTARMVPTRTAAEWLSVINNPNGLSIGGCCSAGGSAVGGYCWYLGAYQATCTATCASRGGDNAATINYTGTSGSAANCQTVMSAIASTSGGTTDTPIGAGVGCYTFGTSGSQPYRGTAVATTYAAYTNVYRACACNN